MTKKTVAAIPAGLLLIGALIAGNSAPASAQSLKDLTDTCAGCHGEAGVPMDKTIPVIWGQKRLYILNQLWDFKYGRRKNDMMTPIVDGLSKSDMESLATYFSEQKWPEIEHTAPSAEDVKTARGVLDTVNCDGCHQAQYEGDTQRPRLAGQQAEYLLKTMNDFRTDERKTYIGMTALLQSVHEETLKPVAEYLASLKVTEDKK
jgi:cytochrome c553